MRDAGTKQQLSASPSAEVPVSDWFWKQLEVLGNPHYVEQLQEQGAHVSYPLMPKQVENWKNGDDIESFRWFSKHLKPLAPLHRDQPTELKELAKKLLLPMYRKIGSAP